VKKYWLFGVAICTALLLTVQSRAGSQPERSAGITFLHLRATATGFELVEARTVNGSLRIRRYDPAKPGLHVEVRTADNRVLFREVYPEPTVSRLEYEDPEHPGKIRTQAVAVPSEEFTIRVPYFSDGRTVHFYRHVEGGVSGTNAPLLIHQGEVKLPAQ